MKARFTEEELHDAVERVLGEESISYVVKTSTVSRNTLKRRVAVIANGEMYECKRPGPKPLLPAECEADLVTWIAAMQRAMVPVQPWEVLKIANELQRSIRGGLRSVTDLTYGWYTRFMGHHSELSIRASEPLSRTHQGADEHAFPQLFHSVCRSVIENKLGATRIFNMDETSFVSKHQSKAVVAVRGSSNVWTKVPEASFRLSVVVTVSADGTAVPPLFIVPGKRISRATIDGCTIPGAEIITVEKGFLSANIFELWIDHFADSIPACVPRPVLLICDGCSSHVGISVLRRCELRGVHLILLPPNATHLVQSLDVAVFRGYKREVSKMLRRVLHRSQKQSLSKKEAVAVASAAYNSKVVGNKQAAVNGFRVCGLYPPSQPAMNSRLKKSKDGGITKSELGQANWLRVRDKARAQILGLPPSPVRKKGSRKTIDADNRIVRKENMLQTPSRKKAKSVKLEVQAQEAPAPIVD